MNRRSFFKAGGLAAATAGLGAGVARPFVPAHNWDKHDFGAGPAVSDRLNQGPFPQYPPDAVFPGGEVLMATTPSHEVVPNFGKGLITYITADMGTAEIKSDNIPQAIEELVRLPLGEKLYLRPTWREVQPHPGRLDFPDYWKHTFELAQHYNKRIGFRIQMRAPDYAEEALPDFVLEKVPMVQLRGEWRTELQGPRRKAAYYEPRYDHPYFQQCFRELNQLLAAELDGSPRIEFMDTFMYGFWGEGHTWPFQNNPFPDYPTAERTWIQMFEIQKEHWPRTPLVTNTQPDFSRVGNSELVDRTVRSGNWLRTDTIFIENEQIECLSNRPPWVGAVVEVGMSDGTPESLHIQEGVTYTDNVIAHVGDVGPHFWSLWNFHKISAENILRYYRQYPQAIDQISRRIGYRVRPSFIWQYAEHDHQGLIMGFANDGLAGVPGALRVYVTSDNGDVKVGGSLDAGYPLPGKIRQAQFVLPRGVDWKGLKLRAEIEVRGARHPVKWACQQRLNSDGSLTLRPNLRGSE
jgi:hypothetical protein